MGFIKLQNMGLPQNLWVIFTHFSLSLGFKDSQGRPFRPSPSASALGWVRPKPTATGLQGLGNAFFR